MPIIRVREPTATSIAGVSVGSSSTQVLAANDDRVYAAIVNDSDEDVYLARGQTAVMNQGIRINSGGGSYEITELNPWTGVVNAISASGSKTVTVQEDTA